LIHRGTFKTLTVLMAGLALAGSGCRQLPGTSGEQGAAIGGVGGAATGALIGGEHHRLLGALLGGALGAGGGYLIGANKNRILGHDTQAAQTAVQSAQAHPATPEMALNAPTADLNGDGFVTMDEVVAMKRAGLRDQDMLQKLQATGQVFELTPQQQAYLRDNGVDQYVIDQMPQLNRDLRNQLRAPQSAAPAPNPALNQPVPPPPGP
jgi:Glycine zipper 2TM domain